MRQTDEAAGVSPFRLAHAIIDGSTDREVRLIKAGAAGENRGVDAGRIHHANM